MAVEQTQYDYMVREVKLEFPTLLVSPVRRIWTIKLKIELPYFFQTTKA
jgi:hypothetical protein